MKNNPVLKFIVFLIVFTHAANAQDLLWAKQSEGLGTAVSTTMITDELDNSFVAGDCTGTVDFDPGPGVYNLTAASNGRYMFIQKLDANGGFIWAKKIGNETGNSMRSITLDVSGNIYTTGYFRGTCDFDPGPAIYNLTAASITSDVFILKLDPNGNFIWAKSIGDAFILDGGQSIKTDQYSNVYYSGRASQNCDYNPGPGTFYLAADPNSLFTPFISKLDSMGNFIWAKILHVSGYGFDMKIEFGSSGQYLYCFGSYEGSIDADPGINDSILISNGYLDLILEKLDTAGNLIWVKTFGGPGHDYASSLAISQDEEIYINGKFTNTVDFDPGPAAQNYTSVGQGDYFLEKLDSNGNFIWLQQISGNNVNCYLTSLWVDNSNNVLSTGYFSDTLTFAANGTQLISNGGVSDGTLFSYSEDGDILWAHSIGSSGVDQCYSVVTNMDDQIYLCGGFGNTVDFDFSASIYTMNSISLVSSFVMKMDPFVVGLDTKIAASYPTWYPNPTVDAVQLRFEKNQKKVDIKVSDTQGQIISLNTYSDVSHISYDMSRLSPGMYFLESFTGNSKQTSKIIKQ
jgi:hypothetical protein